MRCNFKIRSKNFTEWLRFYQIYHWHCLERGKAVTIYITLKNSTSVDLEALITCLATDPRSLKFSVNFSFNLFFVSWFQCIDDIFLLSTFTLPTNVLVTNKRKQDQVIKKLNCKTENASILFRIYFRVWNDVVNYFDIFWDTRPINSIK